MEKEDKSDEKQVQEEQSPREDATSIDVSEVDRSDSELLQDDELSTETPKNQKRQASLESKKLDTIAENDLAEEQRTGDQGNKNGQDVELKVEENKHVDEQSEKKPTSPTVLPLDRVLKKQDTQTLTKKGLSDVSQRTNTPVAANSPSPKTSSRQQNAPVSGRGSISLGGGAPANRAAKKFEQAKQERFWERQTDVDRFTQDTKTRKLIQDLTMPILDNQTKLQSTIEYELKSRLNDLEDRLARTEYALYKTENPDTRFEKIYDQLLFLESSRQKDSKASTDQRSGIDKLVNDTLFNMDCQFKELDSYKVQYEALAQEMERQTHAVKAYMDLTGKTLGDHVIICADKLVKMADELTKIGDLNTQYKFDIDRLQAASNMHTQQVLKSQEEIMRLQQDTTRLEGTKTDLKQYNQTIDEHMEAIKAIQQVSNDAFSQTQTVVEFLHKFEPIYIQRQITQALQYVFPDSTIQWRLNWFNEVKMPVLTTLLLHESEISLEENMKKFKAMIKLDSLTQSELYVKNAMKSQEMHTKGVEIIIDTMTKLIQNSDGAIDDPGLREINSDTFLQRLNTELMNADPTVAIKLGIKVDHKNTAAAVTHQTPEELAAEEAEREKMLQQSMQAEVVNIVLERLDTTMQGFDKKIKLNITDIQNQLAKKFESHEVGMQSSVKTLEKYIEEVHSQQIQDYEKLKKIATDAALGISSTNAAIKDDIKTSDEKQGGGGGRSLSGRGADPEAHAQCSKDYVIVCREQKRLEQNLGEIFSLINEFITAGMQREVSFSSPSRAANWMTQIAPGSHQLMMSMDQATLSCEPKTRLSCITMENNYGQDENNATAGGGGTIDGTQVAAPNLANKSFEGGIDTGDESLQSPLLINKVSQFDKDLVEPSTKSYKDDMEQVNFTPLPPQFDMVAAAACESGVPPQQLQQQEGTLGKNNVVFKKLQGQQQQHFSSSFRGMATQVQSDLHEDQNQLANGKYPSTLGVNEQRSSSQAGQRNAPFDVGATVNQNVISGEFGDRTNVTQIRSLYYNQLEQLQRATRRLQQKLLSSEPNSNGGGRGKKNVDLSQKLLSQNTIKKWTNLGHYYSKHQSHNHNQMQTVMTETATATASQCFCPIEDPQCGQCYQQVINGRAGQTMSAVGGQLGTTLPASATLTAYRPRTQGNNPTAFRENKLRVRRYNNRPDHQGQRQINLSVTQDAFLDGSPQLFTQQQSLMSSNGGRDGGSANNRLLIDGNTLEMISPQGVGGGAAYQDILLMTQQQQQQQQLQGFVDLRRSIQTPTTASMSFDQPQLSQMLSPKVVGVKNIVTAAGGSGGPTWRQANLINTRRNIRTGSTVINPSSRSEMHHKKQQQVVQTSRNMPQGWNKVPDGFKKLRGISTGDFK